jgi:hypothetical protein
VTSSVHCWEMKPRAATGVETGTFTGAEPAQEHWVHTGAELESCWDSSWGPAGRSTRSRTRRCTLTRGELGTGEPPSDVGETQAGARRAARELGDADGHYSVTRRKKLRLHWAGARAPLGERWVQRWAGNSVNGPTLGGSWVQHWETRWREPLGPSWESLRRSRASTWGDELGPRLGEALGPALGPALGETLGPEQETVHSPNWGGQMLESST